MNRFVKPSQILDLVSQYGTPLYLVDENTLHLKTNELLNAYGNYKGPKRIAYSVKANFNPSILRCFMKDGITFDLTSLGELYFFIYLFNIYIFIIFSFFSLIKLI